MDIKKYVDEIFEKKYTHQADVIIDIYKLFYPDWDDIERFDGWPKCGIKMWKYIMSKFRDFDHKYHPGVMAGGLWFNSGFAADENLGDWEVEKCSVKYLKK